MNNALSSGSCFFMIAAKAAVFVICIVSNLAASAQEAGAIAGQVSSPVTGDMLARALVGIPAIARRTVTDETGRFELRGLAAGQYDLVVTLAEFEPRTLHVAVEPGATARIDVELQQQQIFSLDNFVITVEREGSAKAVNSERTAPNVKNVLSIDSDISATVPNMNIGEIITRISGVAGSYDQGTVNNVNLRGMNFRLTRLSFDGLSSLSGVDGRRPTFTFFSGSLFHQVEIVKSPTPDMSADSIGGNINLITRSPLAMKTGRRASYDVGFNLTAPYSNYKPQQQRERNIQPFFQFDYAELFNVRDGKNNLGLSAAAFSGQSQYEIGTLFNQYQTGRPDNPAYVWDTRASDSINNRRVEGVNLRFEYRPSESWTYFLGYNYNGESEGSIDLQSFRAFSNRTIATIGPNGQPTGNGAILPTYTDTVTEVRAVAGSNVVLRNYHLSAFNKNHIVTLGGRNVVGPWTLAYRARYNILNSESGAGKGDTGGDLTMTAPSVGWRFDRTDPDHPIFTQTAGPSIYNPSSYTNTVRFTKRGSLLRNEIMEGTFDVSRALSTHYPITLQAGVAYKLQDFELSNQDARQWDAVAGSAALPAVFMPPTPYLSQYPIIEPQAVRMLTSDPALWRENEYYRASQRYIGSRGVEETVFAQYAMAELQANHLTALGGVRFEQTQDDSFAYVQYATTSAAQVPDAVERARLDWNHRLDRSGSYSRAFPSLHLTYRLRKDLVARASWSTSFGRPDFTTLMPTTTVNNTTEIVTIGNPGVGPQYAQNADLKLTYYITPAGFISAGYFHKEINDYIRTEMVGTVGAGSDNGFDGNYVGYELRSAVNAGTAKVSGWEFDYRQRFTFLPGPLKGLGLAANFTFLETKGDFGDTLVLANDEVEGFIPKSGSVSLTYNYRRFGARAVLNLIEPYLVTYSADVTDRRYNARRSTVSLNVNYNWSQRFSIYCQLNNLTQQTQDQYSYRDDRLQQRQYISAAIQFGIKGQF